VIEYRFAEGDVARLPALTAELVALKVDVIVAAGGSLGVLAAKQATTTIPIVFPAVGEPVAEGLVASLARPGGNATGLAVLNTELIGKRLELARQLVPHTSRAAFLLKPDAASHTTMKSVRKSAEVAARALRVRLQVVEARGPEDFERAFADMTRAGANVLIVHSTPAFDREPHRLAALALRHRLPTVYSFRHNVDAGGLMSYGPDLPDLFRRSASYVVKILKGASPADLPVEQPTTFELVINLKTAKALEGPAIDTCAGTRGHRALSMVGPDDASNPNFSLQRSAPRGARRRR
jgi:putative ABC transport system substrate-binding protein